MKILTQPSESSHMCNSICLLHFFQNGEAIEAGRDGDEEERARPAHRLHRLQAAIPLGQGQVKDDYWGKILSVELWGMPSAIEETGDFQVSWRNVMKGEIR